MKVSDIEIISILKEDIFGSIVHGRVNGQEVICRNYSEARNFVAGFIARILAKNESNILSKSASIDKNKVPVILFSGKGFHCRSYIPGKALSSNPQNASSYYDKARELVNELHHNGIIHNDLEKPQNWIVNEQGDPAIVDFQLSLFFNNRSNKLFSIGKQEDIRHLYKNKKRYCCEGMTVEELENADKKHLLSILVMRYIKPIYNFVTRKIMNYSDRANSKYSR